MLDVAGFRALWPEFDGVEPAIVESCVATAAALTDPEVFGDATDRAHGLLAAHLLISDPSGREARLKGGGFDSVYLHARRHLEMIHCSHWIVP